MTVAAVRATARLEVASLSKSFGAVRALDSVSLAIDGGEVVALVGENGAGKSTLIKILAGVLAADSGTVRISGEAAELASPAQAMAHGIAVIHQERMLCDNLSVAANLFLGREPLRSVALGWIDGRGRDREARRALERVGLECDPSRPLEELGPAARQLVEIARALAQDAHFVVMDEPTSSLDHHDSARLLELVSDLRRRGTGVLYVSHRLEEVVRVADRAVVLRDGARAGELERGEIEERALVRLMLGDAATGVAATESTRDRDRRVPAPLLVVRDLALERGAPTLAFTLRRGEILGLFGLVGAGRTELLETLFGLRRAAAGTLTIVDGDTAEGEQPFAPASPVDAIAAGLALLPEDRASQGLVAEMTVGDNLSLAALARRPLLAWRDRGAERRRAELLCAALDIRPPRPELETRRLSGGNQQKVVLGKWLTPEDGAGAADGAVRILLLDEPTRGVDVGARAEIHRRLRGLAATGMAILVSSAETEEILALAGRALVLRRGAIAGVLEGAALTEENLLRLAAGA